MPCEPVQLAEVVNQPKTWAKKPISARLRTATGASPGDEESLRSDQEEVGHRGQGDGEHQADDDRACCSRCSKPYVNC